MKGLYAGRARRALSRRQYAGCRHYCRGDWLTRDFPFVFCAARIEEVKARRWVVKALARENYLRVGAVLVELTRAGKPLEVGRFALNPVLAQATIRGAGLIWA